MTTIAVDKKTIAWDSLYTVGQTDRLPHNKTKVITRNGIIYAAAGEVMSYDEYIGYYLGECDPPRVSKDSNWELIVIDNGKVFWCSDAALTLLSIKPPFAIGSGGNYARAVLEFGGTAREAVKIASKLDIHTGGKIKDIQYAKSRRK